MGLRTAAREQTFRLGPEGDVTPPQIVRRRDAEGDETVALMRWLADPTSIDWQAYAACDGAELKMFFPVAGYRVDPEDNFTEEVEATYPTSEAKALCGRCPVKDICLGWAQNNREPGTWGGTSTYQREQMLRRRARRSCPGCSSTTIIDGRERGSDVQICLACGCSWPT